MKNKIFRKRKKMVNYDLIELIKAMYKSGYTKTEIASYEFRGIDQNKPSKLFDNIMNERPFLFINSNINGLTISMDYREGDEFDKRYLADVIKKLFEVFDIKYNDDIGIKRYRDCNIDFAEAKIILNPLVKSFIQKKVNQDNKINFVWDVSINNQFEKNRCFEVLRSYFIKEGFNVKIQEVSESKS